MRDKIMEALDKLQFFGGQRAGRELWADKPTDVQDADIAAFNENVDAIRGYIQRLEEDKARLGCTITQLSGTIKHLRDVESRIPHWISVEERMPEDGMEVIVCTIHGDVTWAYYRYSRMEWFRNCIRFTQTVTHWMPMPEPPKEE